MSDTKNAIAKGFIIPQVLAIVVSLGLWFLVEKTTASPGSDNVAIFISSQFVLIPILIGILSSWYWRNSGLRTGRRFGYAVYHFLIICAWAAIILREGFLCLIILTPLLYVFLCVGIFVGYFMFRRKNNTVNLSIISLIGFLFIVDLFSPHEFEQKVEDVMVINAPIEKVWPHVVAYDEIKEKPKFWLFQIGMPRPVASTVTAYKQGAGRKCIFHNGYTFDEIMTVYKPNQELTFEITRQPRDPEIMGHIDILKGQFLLKDNGDGTTTLTGNSWYRLYVFPSWYYDMWARSITRNVHLRVMEHVKQLAEGK